MKLQKATLFALYATLELAREPQRQFSTSDIAEKYGISTHHLAKVMRNLVRVGMIESVRGVGGGYRFAGDIDRTTLLDVIQLFEPMESDLGLSGDASAAAVPILSGLRHVSDEMETVRDDRRAGSAPAAPPPARASFGLREAGIVFAVALVLRLVHLWCVRDMPFVEVPIVDARAYDEWGQRIAAGDWWGSEVFYQAPLYPYLLGSFYAVFGHQLMGVHVLQMTMGAASCVLLALGAQALFRDRSVALATGLAIAAYPPAIFFDGLIGGAMHALALKTRVPAV